MDKLQLVGFFDLMNNPVFGVIIIDFDASDQSLRILLSPLGIGGFADQLPFSDQIRRMLHVDAIGKQP